MKHSTAVRAMALSADGKWLFVGGDVDRKEGRPLLQVFSTATGAPIGKAWRDTKLSGSGGIQGFTHLCVSLDGEFLISAHESHGGVQLWSIEGGHIERELAGRSLVRGLALSPDGSELHGVDADLYRVRWDTQDWGVARYAVLEEDEGCDDDDFRTHSIDAAAYYDGVRGMALATSEGVVSLWRAPFTVPLGGVRLSSIWVEGMCADPSGSTVVVAGQVAQPGGSWGIAWIDTRGISVKHQELAEADDGIGPIVDLCFCGDVLLTAHWSGGPRGTQKGQCIAWRDHQRMGDYDLEGLRPTHIVGSATTGAFWVGTVSGELIRFDCGS